MRASTTALLAALVGLSLANPALAESRTFDLTGFDRVDISTGLDARVRLGNAFAVTADSRSRDALDNLELRVENGVLVARIESNFLDFILSGGLVGMLFSSGNAVSVDLTLPALTGVTASSGADVDVEAIKTDRLSLDASSGANIDLTRADIGTLIASASSGSDISIDGKAQRADLNASSGSDIDAEDLVAGEAQVEASSGANIDIHVTDAVRAHASSGGDIEILGDPRQRDVDASSGGEVKFDD